MSNVVVCREAGLDIDRGRFGRSVETVQCEEVGRVIGVVQRLGRVPYAKGNFTLCSTQRQTLLGRRLAKSLRATASRAPSSWLGYTFSVATPPGPNRIRGSQERRRTERLEGPVAEGLQGCLCRGGSPVLCVVKPVFLLVAEVENDEPCRSRRQSRRRLRVRLSAQRQDALEHRLGVIVLFPEKRQAPLARLVNSTPSLSESRHQALSASRRWNYALVGPRPSSRGGRAVCRGCCGEAPGCRRLCHRSRRLRRHLAGWPPSKSSEPDSDATASDLPPSSIAAPGTPPSAKRSSLNTASVRGGGG